MTRTVNCKSCQAPIVWLTTSLGRNMPVNADKVEAGDWQFDPKKHVSHFATCPQANQHRKAKP